VAPNSKLVDTIHTVLPEITRRGQDWRIAVQVDHTAGQGAVAITRVAITCVAIAVTRVAVTCVAIAIPITRVAVTCVAIACIAVAISRAAAVVTRTSAREEKENRQAYCETHKPLHGRMLSSFSCS